MPDYTILIIDYEPRSVQRLRQLFFDAGYRIELASDGISGLQKFKETSPDLVLVEAMIPKKSGFEVCMEIKQTEAGGATPVLIITSVYKGRKYRSQALHHYKADEYIEKPVTDKTLLEKVGGFLPLDGSEPTREAIAPTPYTPPILRSGESGGAGSAAAAATEIDAETEISEKLDSLLGDPEASVVQFDPLRSFERESNPGTGRGRIRLGGGGPEPAHAPAPSGPPITNDAPAGKAPAPAFLGVRLGYWVALALVAAAAVLLGLIR